MQKRGWDVKESAVMAITANELDTARRRTTGSMDALKAAGFPEKQIYQVPTKSNDIRGAFGLPTQCWFNIRKLNIG